MSHVRFIIAVAAVPLVLWLFLPVASNGQQLQKQDRAEAAGDRGQEEA